MKGTTEELLNKAGRSIEASRMLAQRGDYDFSASRAYYAMFYIAEALLNDRGLHFRKHSAVHAAFGEQFARTEILDPKFHRWLLDSSDKRHLGDYEVGITLTGEDVEQMIDQAKEFLQASTLYLANESKPGTPGPDSSPQ